MKKQMLSEILNGLVKSGFLFVENVLEDQYYFSDGEIEICCVTPHKGTGYVFMLRAVKKSEFSGWAYTPVEEMVDSLEEFKIFLEVVEEYRLEK